MGEITTVRELVVAKVQAAYGSAEALNVSTDSILVANPAWSYVDTRMLSREVKKATLGPLKQVYAGSLVQISFDVELKGSGSAGVPPELAHSLVACGWTENIAAGVSVTYSLASLGQQYLTLHYYQDGKRKGMQDAVGDVTFNAGGGSNFGVLSFTITGHEIAEIDAPYPSPSFDASVPVPYINAPFSIGGFGADISALSWSTGNTIAKPDSVASADGYGKLRITARDPAGSFDPLDELLADNDFVAQWKSGAALALDTGVVGSVAGNRWQLTMPAVSYRSVGQGDRQSLRALDIAFGAAESSGDDQISLVFT